MMTLRGEQNKLYGLSPWVNWKKNSGSGPENLDYSHRGYAMLTTQQTTQQKAATDFADKRQSLGWSTGQVELQLCAPSPPPQCHFMSWYRNNSVVRNSKYKKPQRFGNWICFRPQVRGGRHLLYWVP
jgi:hypothetical protein